MVRRSSGKKRRASSGDRSGIRSLKIMNMVLIVIVLGLVVYVMYPAVKSALVGQPLGNTLAGINNPISQSQLAVINGAPDSYFEQAGEMMLNISLPGETATNEVYSAPEFEIAFSQAPQFPILNYDGKPSVVYIGAISCLWCGENRWAMAMALSRFGNFSNLYTGYSSIHDQDLPTLYWKPQDIHSNGTANFGNYYSSGYINFFSAEYDSNISSGFEFVSSANPISFFVSRAPNASYSEAMSYMNQTKAFAGTPFTLWGTAINRGSVGIDFGAAQNASVASGGGIPLTYMTHQQIFSQLGSFSTPFAQEEYAVADVYIAQVCPSLNNSAPICSLPAIRTFEQKMGLS